MSAVAISQSAAKSRRSVSTPLTRWLCYLLASLVLLRLIFQGLETSVFGTYWATGAAIAHGLNPYAAFAQTFRTHLPGRDVADINLNPPCLLPLFHALSHLSLARFAMVWTAGSFVLLFSIVAMLLWNRPGMQHRQVMWLLLARPVFETLWSGQVYFLLFFFSALALVCAERRRWLGAAFAIGLVVAIKPTMIFWPLFLFVGNYRRLALHAVVIAGTVSIAPLPFYGVGVYRAWLVAVLHDNHWLLPSDIAIPAIFARHGMHLVGLGLAAAVTILLCWTIRKKKLDIYAISGIGLCAGILCAPLAWYDYVLAVAPWFAAQHWGLAATLVALALMSPPFAVFPPIGYFAAICLMTSLFLIRPADQLTHA